MRRFLLAIIMVVFVWFIYQFDAKTPNQNKAVASPTAKPTVQIRVYSRVLSPNQLEKILGMGVIPDRGLTQTQVISWAYLGQMDMSQTVSANVQNITRLQDTISMQNVAKKLAEPARFGQTIAE